MRGYTQLNVGTDICLCDILTNKLDLLLFLLQKIQCWPKNPHSNFKSIYVISYISDKMVQHLEQSIDYYLSNQIDLKPLECLWPEEISHFLGAILVFPRNFI